ncbi:MAG: DNA-binding transcriptional regulator, GntR family [Modestobacter sp.]|nr:DNA-binding transcriptional regulator, GntR family [Modestobacter sp.]
MGVMRGLGAADRIRCTKARQGLASDLRTLLGRAVEMPLRPIRASSLADLAHERLTEALLSGDLAPGDRLVQDALALRLGISRTPLREALQRLEREGTIRAAGGRGYVVPELTRADIAHLYEVREAVEGHAARLVAARATSSVDAIEAELHRLSAAAGPSGRDAFQANRLAHRAVVEQAGNPFLLEHFDDLWGRSVTLQAWGDYYASVDPHIDLVTDHADVLAALRSGDPERAGAVMVEHVREGLDRHQDRRVPQVGAAGHGRG